MSRLRRWTGAWTPDWTSAAAGAVAGIVLTVLLAALVWPEAEYGAGGADVALPVVPPSPDPSAAETESGWTDAPESEEVRASAEDYEQPSEAALLTDAPPAGEGPLPATTPAECPPATVEVSDSESLQAALDAAEPGAVIGLADGSYPGRFVTSVSGTRDAPTWLCGSAEAVLDGGDVDDSGYTLHLDGAQYWRLVGFTVTGGQKGVMADGTVGSVIQGLTVSGTGDEAIHLRSHSTDNLVLGNTITDTGLSSEKYGEGVYLGSAVSNWCTYTDCLPDRSDRNVVKGNTITGTTSEAIDVKEGTTGGALLDNVFDGSAMTEADTWVNLKGNNYLVQGNHGSYASENGFETHDILPGWGDFNVFAENTGVVGGTGYGIASWPPGSNVVRCSNDLRDAAEGLSNIPCT